MGLRPNGLAPEKSKIFRDQGPSRSTRSLRSLVFGRQSTELTELIFEQDSNFPLSPLLMNKDRHAFAMLVVPTSINASRHACFIHGENSEELKGDSKS